MQSRMLTPEPARTYVMVLDRDDEVVAELTAFARREGLTAAWFTGIGAFRDAVIAYFDWARKDYDRIRIAEPVEVLSITGNIALDDGEPKVHAHVALGKRDGTAHGGHLMEGHVQPTLELVLSVSPSTLTRVYDETAKLPLIDLDAWQPPGSGGAPAS